MFRKMIALAFAGLVAGCGGVPSQTDPIDGVGSSLQPMIYESNASRAEDPIVTGSQVGDLTGERVSFAQERLAEPTAGRTQYYAVFRSIAAAPGGYAVLGQDGLGTVSDAPSGYVFSGEYAGVRALFDSAAQADVHYVTGTMELGFGAVDAARGVVADRGVFGAGRNGSVLEFIPVANTALWMMPTGQTPAGIVFVEGDGPIGIDATGSLMDVTVRNAAFQLASR